MRSNLSFFLFFIISGCKHAENRKVFYTFPNGKAGQVRYYDNPGDSSTYRKEEFYSNGIKYYIGEVINGKKNGTWIWWYLNGNKKDQCKYADGFVIDTVFHWYRNGIIKQIEIVTEGKHLTDSCNQCNGKIIRYYENGKPKEMFTNIDEIQQDSAKTWYDNGQLEWYTFFKDGKEEGLSESFYSNGQKRKSGILVNGLTDGKVTQWDSLGKIISVTNYKMDKIVN